MQTSTATTKTASWPPLSYDAYKPGHPWYFMLGGPIPTPKAIRQMVLSEGYYGYDRERIRAIAAKPEPHRSRELDSMRAKVKAALRQDISYYRRLAFELRRLRDEGHVSEEQGVCDDIHVSLGLKLSHIYNGFGHLALLDQYPAQQGDLFALF